MARTPYSTALGYRTPDGFSWHVKSAPKFRCGSVISFWRL